MNTLIVIQNRNDARYLPAVINSVLAQTLDTWTLVGIDAGSTDNSVALYESYSRWMDWVDCSGLNQAASVNRVLQKYRMADWDFFTWINADDWYTPDHLEKHRNAFTAYPDADIVCSDALIFYEEETEHGVRPFVAGNPVAQWEVNHNMVSQPTAVIRRSVFRDIGLFSESVVCPFDYEFWVRAHNFSKRLHVIHEPTAWRRKLADCMSSKRSELIRGEMATIHEQFKTGAKQRGPKWES